MAFEENSHWRRFLVEAMQLHLPPAVYQAAMSIYALRYVLGSSTRMATTAPLIGITFEQASRNVAAIPPSLFKDKGVNVEVDRAKCPDTVGAIIDDHNCPEAGHPFYRVSW